MKEIYIILSFTGTILSRVIKKYTKNEFAHVSISLDKNLTKMYSFGRLNPYNPFIGGFVHEGIKHGTFKRFKNTEVDVYAITVTNEQYDIIEKAILNISQNRKKFKFNIIGLFAVAFNKRITSDFSFYCAEFVKYLLEVSNIEHNLPELVKPEDFKNLPNKNLIYKGNLRKYPIDNKCLVNRLMIPINLKFIQ